MTTQSSEASQLKSILEQLESLQAKVARQEAEIGALKAQPPAARPPTTSRRRLLKSLLVGAAVAVPLTTFRETAQAGNGSNINIGSYFYPGNDPNVIGLPTAGVGVAGSTSPNFTSPASFKAGVYGITDSNTTNASGVYGLASASTGGTNGVYGETFSTSSSSYGVFGRAAATSGATAAVRGFNNSNTDLASGVFGTAIGTGAVYGVRGELTAGNTSSAAVYGKATIGKGVWGEGTDSVLGVGGYFAGPNAAIQFGASSNQPGYPTTGPHNTGSVYVDSLGGIFYCVAGAGGGGTWRKLAGQIKVGNANYYNAGTFHILPQLERFIDTRTPFGTAVGPTNVILASGEQRSYIVAGVNGQSQNTNLQVPLEAVAIMGIIHPIAPNQNVVAAPGALPLKIWGADPEPSGVTLYKTGGIAASTTFVTNLTVVNGPTQIGFKIKTSFQTHVAIDIIGYYL